MPILPTFFQHVCPVDVWQYSRASVGSQTISHLLHGDRYRCSSCSYSGDVLPILTLDAEISKFILKPNPVDFEVIIGNNFEGLYNPLWLNEFINTWSLAPSDNGLAHEAIQALGKLVTTKMDIPTVGASGAVFGILLAYGMLFPNTLLYIYFLFPIKAKWFVIIMVL